MPKNGRKSGETMGFDTRESVPVTCPITCSKKTNATCWRFFFLEIDRTLTRVVVGENRESDLFARYDNQTKN